jgi:hypothetical protein
MFNGAYSAPWDRLKTVLFYASDGNDYVFKTIGQAKRYIDSMTKEYKLYDDNLNREPF